jgi:MFS family permease
MTGLGLVWLLHARTGSYGTAGLAAAGFALAEAPIGPQLARLIDRFGQTRVLPLCLLAHAAAIAGVLMSTTAAAQITAATCAGAVVPQLGALSGARWAHLLRGERAGELPTAFALESLANATAFLIGPVLVASLGAVGDAALASGIAAGLILGERLAGGLDPDQAGDVVREVMALLGHDVDPAVAEVTDQQRAGRVTPAGRRDRQAPRGIERTAGGYAGDQVAVRAELVHHAQVTPDRLPAGGGVGLVSTGDASIPFTWGCVCY